LLAYFKQQFVLALDHAISKASAQFYY
jgi:hypothetical protein